MAIQRKVIPAAFSTGIDTGRDPKLVAKGLLRLVNCIAPRAGALTVRNGTNILDASGSFTQPYCASYKDRAVLIDEKIYLAEGSLLSNQELVEVATIERWKTDNLKLEVASGSVKHNAEVLEIGSIRCWTYMEYNAVGSTFDLIVETYNRYSNRLIAKTIVLAAAAYDETHPRLVPNTDDTKLFLLWVDTGTLRWREINTATGAVSGATNTTAGLANNVQMDAVAINVRHIIVAHAGTDLKLTTIDTATPGSSTVTIGTTGDCDSVGVWLRTGTEHACISYFDDSDFDLRLVIYDQNLGQILGPTDIRNLGSGAIVNVTGICPDSVKCHLFSTEISGSPVNQPVTYHAYCVIPGGTGITNTQLIRRSMVASKPWIPTGSSNQFVWITYDAGKCAYVIGANGDLCGKIMPEAMGGYQNVLIPDYNPTASNPYYIALTHSHTAGYHSTCLRRYDIRERAAVGDTYIPMMVDVFRPPDFQSLEAQDVLLLGGSMPALFDGQSMVEQGYLHTPEAPAATAVADGTSLEAGKYYGAITYRWRDTAGRLHESAPSGMTEITIVDGDRIDWTIPYLSHTLRSDVQVCLWRSKKNQNVLYLRNTWDNVLTLDNPASAYQDSDVDSTLTGNEQIYTRSTPATILENVQPPQSHIQCVHQNRLFHVDDEFPATRVRYTKEFSPGLAAESSDSLVVTVPPEGGDITALASDVDRLLVFKASSIYYFGGRGLDIQGAGLGYSGPRVASDNKGAIGPRLVKPTDLGVIFCGYDRLYVLTKNLQVAPIGDPVRYYTEPESAGKVALKALVHLQKKNLLVVMTDGAALVLDLLHSVWGTWTDHACTDACVLDDLLLFKAPSTNDLRYEAENDWQDAVPGAAGTPIVPVIETGIFQFAGLGGVQFVDNALIYAYCRGAHNLHVAFQYDGEPHNWSDEQKFDASAFQQFTEEAYFGAESVNYRDKEYVLDAEISQDQCAGLRMKIWISGHTGTVNPIDLIGLAFRLGVTDRLRLVGGGREIPLAP